MDSQQQFEIGEALGRIEAEIKGLRTELLGNGQPGRIQRLEERVSSSENKQWIHSGVLVPLNLFLHAIATHFGLKL